MTESKARRGESGCGCVRHQVDLSVLCRHLLKTIGGIEAKNLCFGDFGAKPGKCIFPEVLRESMEMRQELQVLLKVFGAGPSWDQDASIRLRVEEVSNYLLCKKFINFPVPENRLSHAGLRIMVDIMPGALADQITSKF